MRQLGLLTTLLLIGFAGRSQALRVIDAKGHVWRAYRHGDELQLVVWDETVGKMTTVGQLTSIRSDSVFLRDPAGNTQRVAVPKITGIRSLPTMLSGITAGAAVGATTITLIDKRDMPTGPRLGLTLLLGTGVGLAVAYWQRTHQRKGVRHRSERGWSFQVH
ncbi:hypothetical protein [Spirosoma sordidisoli]|uniref:Uncharacterized protein n=1 Tax=Spirosoma sordidisoli TaxID=2502893 RepID=A0A4Q2UDX6_9BACT|nr:hypothetical protein [Spirosoma sordidisoli]RYC66452.1 hypothetical protein EQG79_29170 [Spirosoma sordidisoli]